jgi:glycine/D-amino acid oxidase-like deaminating enzyme
MRRYDVVIAGGGIAGLATAEMFARSGRRVLLLEKNERLCSETSGMHHEWFHFGSLYSIFPRRQFLRTLAGGVEDLLEYYRDFDGMNLRLDGGGKLVKVECENAWFRPQNLEYIIATTRNEDFDLARVRGMRDLSGALYNRLLWNTAIRLFICRHNRFYKHDWRRPGASSYIPRAGVFDYSRKMLGRFESEELDLDPATHITMPSYDGPMNAFNIIADLVRSLLSHGGEILTSTAFGGYRRTGDGIEVAREGGEPVLAGKLILASGAALGEHARGAVRVQSVRSPLLVAYPAVCSGNVVRLTPFTNQTVNHLRHSIDGHDYSLIGGGYFASMNDEREAADVECRLVEKARAVFPRLADARMQAVYFGTKSEVVASNGNRNYLYRIEEIEPDVVAVVPGKFSLAFSLAMTAFKRMTGELPKTCSGYDAELPVGQYVDVTRSKAMVRRFLAEEAAETLRPARTVTLRRHGEGAAAVPTGAAAPRRSPRVA